MFDNRPHKALAAAVIRESKCSSNVHWLSMTRRRHPDSLPRHAYAQAGGRSPSPVLVEESDSFRLCRGYPQALYAHSPCRAGRCDFADPQRLVKSATSDQDQSVVRVAHHDRARRQWATQYLVVRDDPRDPSQHRALRNAALDGPPFSSLSTGVIYPLVIEVGANQPQEVAGNLEVPLSCSTAWK